MCVHHQERQYIYTMYLYYIQRGLVRVCYYYYMYLNWKARTESRRRVGLRNVSRLRVDRDSAMLRPPSSPTTGSRLSLMDGLTKCVTLIFFSSRVRQLCDTTYSTGDLRGCLLSLKRLSQSEANVAVLFVIFTASGVGNRRITHMDPAIEADLEDICHTFYCCCCYRLVQS